MRIPAMILILASSLAVQTRSPHAPPTSRANPDQLGLACAQIVEMGSSDWVSKFTAEKAAGSAETLRAVAVYGKCYDARTNQLAAKLGKTGKGPLMGARGNFQSMEQALKAFTAKALAESQPPADAVKSAYATLYEKQFRYEFYESYEPAPALSASAPAANSSLAQAAPTTSTAQTPPSASASSTPDAARSGSKNNKNNDREIDPLTAAKNHFGELLGDLPDEQIHDLHQSFGQILGPNSASPRMQLLVYRYAIFLLESPAAKPFAPPPF